VRSDCRHYVMQTVQPSSRRGAAERVERCRLEANETLPFSCPAGCLFFEPRATSSAGWQVGRPPT